MKRLVAGLLALILAANGLAMLFAGHTWYDTLPGATMTGPFNPHFVKDIGVAYLVCAAAVAWLAARGAQATGAGVAALGFLGLHAAVHVVDEFAGGHVMGDFTRDFAGVFMPPLLIAWILWPEHKTP